MVGWAPEDNIWSIVGLTGGVKCFEVNIKVVGRIVTALSVKPFFFTWTCRGSAVKYFNSGFSTLVK